MAIKVGIDMACHGHHRGVCAKADGALIWNNVRFQTRTEGLENICRLIPDGETEVTIAMESTRIDWIPIAAWIRWSKRTSRDRHPIFTLESGQRA